MGKAMNALPPPGLSSPVPGLPCASRACSLALATRAHVMSYYVPTKGNKIKKGKTAYPLQPAKQRPQRTPHHHHKKVSPFPTYLTKYLIMACPFCALGCRDGFPQISEVNRNWKIRQLAVHPDHIGGSTVASTFLNQTRDYAVECLNNNSASKPVAISCQRHGKPCRNETGNIHPEYYRQSTASASADKFPPPPPSSAQAAKHHSKLPYPDPWVISEEAARYVPVWSRKYPQTTPTTPAPEPQSQPQQESPSEGDTQLPHSAPHPPPQPGNQKTGWYKQTFRCRWCESEKVYQGHGSWPFTQALQDGWNKPASKPWAGRASCKACTAKFYGSTAEAHHAPLPTPILASPQPASFSPW